MAVALGVFASGVLGDLPKPEEVIEDLAQSLGAWTYALVGVLAFLETGAFIGFVVPGEVATLVGGLIAGQGEINVIVLIGIVWFATLSGDTVSFVIGDRVGRDFVLKHGGRVGITEERYEPVERYFHRHGGMTLVIGRFLGFVRPLAPFIAGTTKKPYRDFFPYMFVGTGLWSATFCLLGYVFWQSFSELKGIAGIATIALGATVATIFISVIAYKRLRDPEQRAKLKAWGERQAERPLGRPVAAVARPLWRRVLRPVWRVVAPNLRFLWGRLTPGGLGLEFTTAVAVAVAGAYVFILYATVFHGDPGLTPADSELLDLSDELRNGTAVEIAKAVSALGSLAVVASLVGVAAVLLAWQRQPLELMVLVVGFVLIYAGVHLAKAGIDRPRPPDPLVTVSNTGFPSGHAAYATTYVAFAVIAARVIPGNFKRASLITSALVLTAAIGLSRVYLQAHYWSDVAGGWALGFAIFGGAAAIALLVSHIRQNAARARTA